jgi:acyl-coenzyme A thioesterase PaaI-like protein
MIFIEQVAVLEALSHEDYAAMLALLSTFDDTGSAVGSSPKVAFHHPLQSRRQLTILNASIAA